MKTTLLSLLIACIMLPVYGSHFTPPVKERQYTTRMDMLRPSVEREAGTKAPGMFGDLDFGAIFVRNSVQADTLMVKSFDTKDGSWVPFMKEIPFYQGASTITEVTEQWFLEGTDYVPEIKNIAFYDDHDRPTRLEMHHYHDGDWFPVFAIDEQYNEIGEIIYDAVYAYDMDAGGWTMLFGFRATEEYNENGALVLRTWEEFFFEGWVPVFKEEFILNEEDVVVEIIEYYYDDWDNHWEKEYRVVLDLCEENKWQQGYSYVWNWFDEEWELEIKYVDFEWFDFSRMLFTHVHVMADASLFDDWKGDDEVEWVNYVRMTAEYHETGLPLLRLSEDWHGDVHEGEWQPDFKMEYAYDHLLNTVYEMSSFHDGSDWQKMNGHQLDMEYHEDGSIKSFIFHATRDEWKNELNPLLHYTYHYADDTTDAPVVEMPQFDLRLFPNPASSRINVELPGDFDCSRVSIIGADGRIVQTYKPAQMGGSRQLSLDVSGLTSGIYFVRVQGPAGHQSARFIKR